MLKLLKSALEADILKKKKRNWKMLNRLQGVNFLPGPLTDWVQASVAAALSQTPGVLLSQDSSPSQAFGSWLKLDPRFFH